MKTADYLRIKIALVVIALITGCLSSCNEDDEGAKEITVTQVFLHTAANTTGVISGAQIGTLIRIDGSGFSTLRAVYCNGVKASVNPNFVTENSILFSVPSENVPTGNEVEEGVRNTIRIVTKYDDYSHSFLIMSTPPVAVNDAYGIGVNRTLTVPVEIGVLSNDTDAENNELTAVLVSTTSNGTLTLNEEDGSFTYVPNPDFKGSDSFTYNANDGMSNSNSSATVTIVVDVPGISAVSHTLAKAGETIVIYGNGFTDVSTITFPGGVTLTEGQFTVNATSNAITCVVPAGITKGAILIDGDGGAAYSYDYMFRNEGLLFPTFAFGDVYNGSTPGTLGGLTGNQTAVLPATGDPKNPATYRMVPAASGSPSTATLTVSPSAAFTFNFNPKQAAEKAINNSAGLITSSTNCKDVAIQFDIYVPVAWGSGYFKINFLTGNESYSGICPPHWVTIGGGADITMTGWQTATLPLGDVPSLESQTLQHIISTLTANGTFTFMNNNFTLNGANYTAKQITGFSVYFGNFRIVPYKKPG